MKSYTLARSTRRAKAVGLVLVGALIAATVALAAPTNVSPANADTAAGGLFAPLQQRVYDSRTTTYAGNTGNQLAAGRWYPVSVAGVGGAPKSGISAVQVTLTEVNAAAEGNLKADATGVASPNTSVPSLLWTDGKEANAATIPVGADGKFQIYVTSATDIVIDLQGYFTTGTTAAGGYVAGTNEKILNSSSTSYSNSNPITLQVAGTDQVPANASAVMLSVFILPTDATAGNLQVYPAGAPPSTPWLLNWSSNEKTVVTSAVALNSSGKVTIAVQSGSTALAVAVQGYFTPAAAGSTDGSFTALRARAFDTRSGTSLAPDETRTFQVTGVNGIPDSSTTVGALAANLVIYPGSNATTGQGSVQMYADDEDENSSTQYFYPGEKVSAFSVTKVGDDGGINVHNSSTGTIDVLLDVEGWFQAPAELPAPADGSSGIAPESATFLANQDKLADFKTWIHDQAGFDTSGYIDQINDSDTLSTQLLWHGSSSLRAAALTEASSRGIKATIVERPYSLPEINAATNKILDHASDLAAAGFVVTSVIGVQADVPGIQIEGDYQDPSSTTSPTTPGSGTTPSSTQRASVDNKLDQYAGVDVSGVQGTGSGDAKGTRGNDTSPFSAGGYMVSKTGGHVCSTGFAVRYKKAVHITTAAHCNQDWSTDSGNRHIGKIMANTGAAAVSILPASGRARTYDGAWNNANGYGKKVRKLVDVSIGDKVCTSGGNSGVHCNIKVVAENVTKFDDLGNRYSTIKATQQSSGKIAVIMGDSGGPVFTTYSGNYKKSVGAAGMIQNYGDPVKDCGSVSDAPGNICGRTVFFSSIRTAINDGSLAISLVTNTTKD